jgi:hypothetical protein
MRSQPPPYRVALPSEEDQREPYAKRRMAVDDPEVDGRFAARPRIARPRMWRVPRSSCRWAPRTAASPAGPSAFRTPRGQRRVGVGSSSPLDMHRGRPVVAAGRTRTAIRIGPAAGAELSVPAQRGFGARRLRIAVKGAACSAHSARRGRARSAQAGSRCRAHCRSVNLRVKLGSVVEAGPDTGSTPARPRRRNDGPGRP